MKVVRDGKERTLNVKVEELDLEAETGQSQQTADAEPAATRAAGSASR